MATRDMTSWKTSISQVISTETEEEIMVRGQPLSQLIGKVSFAEMMFLMLAG
ncbi:MAG: citryl-CoA lyase, partial [Rhodospirillaceae bacterium]|nr:citryl-CoA lyase [Rhodospirillaceae bacterium]